MSQIVAVTSGQCELEKVEPPSSNKSPLEKLYSESIRIPFFSFYNYAPVVVINNSVDNLTQQYLLGKNWMTVYKSNEIDVHYIKQYRTQRRDTEDAGKNTVFLPHLWNTNLTEISGKEFDCNGTFEAFTFDSGVFKQLTFSETHASGANAQDTYDNAKVYTIHAKLNFSDGLKIPEEVMKIVSKEDASVKLFIKFKWNIPTLKQTDLQQPFMNPNETFYGIYEFVNVGTAAMFNTNGIDADTYEPNFQYDTDFEEQFPQNKVTEPEKQKICQLMEQFMANVNPKVVSVSNTSSAAGGGAYQIVSSNINQTPKHIANPVLNTLVAVSNPDPNPDPNPVSNTIVAVKTPAANSMMMPQFGKTNEIYIKVIFDGIVPKTVDIVNELTGISLTDMEYYIDGLLNGSIKSDENPVYFLLEKSYAEDIVK